MDKEREGKGSEEEKKKKKGRRKKHPQRIKNSLRTKKDIYFQFITFICALIIPIQQE